MHVWLSKRASGTKILAFSSGSTASTSGQRPRGFPAGLPAGQLQVTGRSRNPGQCGMVRISSLTRRRETPRPLLEVWSTGENATCGGYTGEIVKLAGIKE